MTQVLLARHGETEWNATHRWQGFTGPPLNDVGRGQAAELARLLLEATPIAAVYSSDSARATETARIVGDMLGLGVARDPRLREVNFGEWEGLTSDEINDRYAGAFAEWNGCKLARPTGGETDQEMADRVIEALIEIAARHRDSPILVVTSGGPIRAAHAHATGVNQALARLQFERAENCALVELAITGDSFELAGTPPV